MPTIYFLGNLLYGSIDLRIDSLKTNDASLDLVMDIGVTIANNEITIKCDINRYDQAVYNITFQRCWHIARTLVGVCSFAAAQGHSAVPTHFIDPSGQKLPIAFTSSSAKGLCKSYSLDRLSEVIGLVIADTQLSFMLIDLNQCLLDQNSALLCGRVIDRLRHAVAGKGIKPEVAWPLVHKALHVDKNYLQMMTEHSKDPRHGDRYVHDIAIVKEIVRRTWVVVDRYIEYKKRGNSPLSDLPLLAG